MPAKVQVASQVLTKSIANPAKCLYHEAPQPKCREEWDMAVAQHIADMIASASFIRKMFETGLRLKAEHGADKVCDFSLGNPSLPPPARFTKVLSELAAGSFEGKHAYMPNAGYIDVRAAVGDWIGKEYGVMLPPGRVIMSCGAGGGLNVVLKTLLNPGDQVLASLPCFMEYRFYAANHNGELRTVPCKADFDLDIDALASAISPKTACVIINSPNNPSGKIYPQSSISALAVLLERKSHEFSRRIYLISDEPYRSIAYGHSVPSVLTAYPHSIIISSYSKELSIPGERIGWIAIHPQAEAAQELFDGMVVCNRVLGYVNAPALMQKAIAACLGLKADMAAYQRKRDLLCPALRDMGYDIPDPDGTFYAFPKVPVSTSQQDRREGGDDLAFTALLQEQLILAVPGRGFGLPGYFRIAYCTDDAIIKRSLPGFKAAIEHARKQS